INTTGLAHVMLWRGLSIVVLWLYLQEVEFSQPVPRLSVSSESPQLNIRRPSKTGLRLQRFAKRYKDFYSSPIPTRRASYLVPLTYDSPKPVDLCLVGFHLPIQQTVQRNPNDDSESIPLHRSRKIFHANIGG